MTGFRSRVYAVVRAIPAGKVASYGDVAAAMGAPRAARQVGWSLAALDEKSLGPQARPVPWHRVILKSGRLAFRGDLVRGTLQRKLLEAEGVVFVGEAVSMDRFRWSAEADLVLELLERA